MDSRVIRVGGLFPLTNHPAGAERAAAARLAVDMVNNSTFLLPKNTLEIIVRDTARKQSVAARSAIELLGDKQVVGLVGAASSSVSEAVAPLSDVFGVHQISYSSTAPILSDKALFPFFMRTVPPDSVQGVAIVALAEEMGWDSLAIVHGEDTYGSGIMNVAREECLKRGIRVVSIVPVSLASEAESSRKRQDTSHETSEGTRETHASSTRQSAALEVSPASLEFMRDASVQTNVFILAAQADLGRAILVEAQSLGLLTAGKAWIATDAVAQSGIFDDASSAAARSGARVPESARSDRRGHHLRKAQISDESLEGVLGVRPADGFGAMKEAFMGKWAELTDAYGKDAGRLPINTYSPFAADAVFAFAHGMQDLLDRGVYTAETLPFAANSTEALNALSGEWRASLYSVRFDGVTGPVVVDDSGDRRGTYEFVNVRAGSGFAPVGTYDAFNGVELREDIIFPGGQLDVVSTPPSADDGRVTGDAPVWLFALMIMLVLIAVVLIVFVVKFGRAQYLAVKEQQRKLDRASRSRSQGRLAQIGADDDAGTGDVIVRGHHFGDASRDMMAPLRVVLSALDARSGGGEPPLRQESDRASALSAAKILSQVVHDCADVMSFEEKGDTASRSSASPIAECAPGDILENAVSLISIHDDTVATSGIDIASFIDASTPSKAMMRAPRLTHAVMILLREIVEAAPKARDVLAVCSGGSVDGDSRTMFRVEVRASGAEFASDTLARFEHALHLGSGVLRPDRVDTLSADGSASTARLAACSRLVHTEGGIVGVRAIAEEALAFTMIVPLSGSSSPVTPLPVSLKLNVGSAKTERSGNWLKTWVGLVGDGDREGNGGKGKENARASTSSPTLGPGRPSASFDVLIHMSNPLAARVVAMYATQSGAGNVIAVWPPAGEIRTSASSNASWPVSSSSETLSHVRDPAGRAVDNAGNLVGDPVQVIADALDELASHREGSNAAAAQAAAVIVTDAPKVPREALRPAQAIGVVFVSRRDAHDPDSVFPLAFQKDPLHLTLPIRLVDWKRASGAALGSSGAWSS